MGETKRVAKKSGKKSVSKSVVPMMPGKNGGLLRQGSLPGNTPGTGRPPDEIRAKMRELGATKAVPFLSNLLDGKVTVSLEGKCDACGHEQPISAELVEQWMERVKASVDHRLKASEQAFKHGLATKELVIANDNAASFFDCISAAATELFGSEGSDALKARAMVLMEGKK